jgi:hypothetical protein
MRKAFYKKIKIYQEDMDNAEEVRLQEQKR